MVIGSVSVVRGMWITKQAVYSLIDSISLLLIQQSGHGQAVNFFHSEDTSKNKKTVGWRLSRTGNTMPEYLDIYVKFMRQRLQSYFWLSVAKTKGILWPEMQMLHDAHIETM